MPNVSPRGKVNCLSVILQAQWYHAGLSPMQSGFNPWDQYSSFSPMRDHRTAFVAMGEIFENCVIWDAYLMLFYKYSCIKQTACTSL